MRDMVRGGPLLVFDVECRGLHREGYAFGAILVLDGEIAARHREWCRPEVAAGDHEGWVWANEHVTPSLMEATGGPTVNSPAQVRGRFWSIWRAAADEHGAQLAADVVWPVEANFLTACVADDLSGRWWSGPYPCIDIATLRIAGLAGEVPDVHEPLTAAVNSWVAMRDWWLEGRKAPRGTR